jgi:hypothetical protein
VSVVLPRQKNNSYEEERNHGDKGVGC